MPSTRKTVQKLDNDVFVAIAHPVRRGILEALASGEMTVSNLAKPFDVSRSAVSQHLGILVEVGLVERERQGREQLYRLRPDNLNEVSRWIAQFEQFWEDRLDLLGNVLDEMAAEEKSDDEA